MTLKPGMLVNFKHGYTGQRAVLRLTSFNRGSQWWNALDENNQRCVIFKDEIESITTEREVALIGALKAARNMIDVSTIRPGKKNEQRWGDLKDRIDTALATK